MRCPDHIHMGMAGYYKRICNTCYGTNQFSEHAMKIARVESTLHAYTPEEIKEFFSKCYYPRTRVKRAIDMYSRTTSMPLFPIVCRTFLDIKSALIVIQVSKYCSMH